MRLTITSFLRSNRRGIIARSSQKNSFVMNSPVRIGKPTRHPITSLSCQDLLTPHSRLSRKQSNAPVNVMTPGISSWRMISFRDTPTFARRKGGRNKGRRTAKVAPPTGTLIQKHHLQVKLLVNSPPITGPAKLASKNARPVTPTSIGLFWVGRRPQ